MYEYRSPRNNVVVYSEDRLLWMLKKLFTPASNVPEPGSADNIHAQTAMRHLLVGRLLEDIDRLIHKDRHQATRITPRIAALMSDYGFLHQLREMLALYQPQPILPNEHTEPSRWRAVKAAWLDLQQKDTMEKAIFKEGSLVQPVLAEKAAKVVFPLQSFRKSVYRDDGGQQAQAKLLSFWQYLDQHVKGRLGVSFTEKISSVIGSGWLDRKQTGRSGLTIVQGE